MFLGDQLTGNERATVIAGLWCFT